MRQEMTNLEAVHRSDLYTMHTQRRKFVEMEVEKDATIHTLRRELEEEKNRFRSKDVELERSEHRVVELEDDKDIMDMVALQLEDSVWELEDTMDRAREEIRGVFVQQY